MTDKMQFVPEVVTLYKSIQDDKGVEISELTLNLIDHKNHAAVIKKDMGENPTFKEFLKPSQVGLKLSMIVNIDCTDIFMQSID